MPSPPAIEYGTIYHIYNRGTDRTNIFRTEQDYQRFLFLLERYVLPVADVFAYSLLRNHFHLGTRTKSKEEIAATPGLAPGKILVPSLQFSHFLNAYAKGFNLKYGRTGSLFQHPFGRKPVLSEDYLQNLIVYIHRNPQTHGLIDDFREWKYSSYGLLMRDTPTLLARQAVWDAFGTRKAALEAHREADARKELEWMAAEDFEEGDDPEG